MCICARNYGARVTAALQYSTVQYRAILGASDTHIVQQIAVSLCSSWLTDIIIRFIMMESVYTYTMNILSFCHFV